MFRHLVFAAFLTVTGSAVVRLRQGRHADGKVPVRQHRSRQPGRGGRAAVQGGARVVVGVIPPPGVEDDGFGPPFCGMNGSLRGDGFSVR
ncbi:MAG: hypothetical protein REJ50_18725 [Bordetella sp.]|nr:hypothetical protein [Bordetella sp.]